MSESEFKELGVALRAYRIAANESIGDVSSALELDEATLQLLENGFIRPNPELIELLARHFTLREQEANRLLELAGYTSNDFELDLDHAEIKIDEIIKNAELAAQPIFYSDTINVVSNQFGVVINFLQAGPTPDKKVVISRIGMSHQHARSVIKVLEESLRQARKSGGEPPKAA